MIAANIIIQIIFARRLFLVLIRMERVGRLPDVRSRVNSVSPEVSSPVGLDLETAARAGAGFDVATLSSYRCSSSELRRSDIRGENSWLA